MIEIKNYDVYNIYNAIQGMRNPLESWEKSDSLPASLCEYERDVIGMNDLKLAQKLVLAGTDHRKFLRQIFVSMDIEAPLYW